MIGTRSLAPAILALLLVAGAAVAQPENDPLEAPPATDDSPSPESASGAADMPARPDRSPTDYRASEEISEDLPVSFPVDI